MNLLHVLPLLAVASAAAFAPARAQRADTLALSIESAVERAQRSSDETRRASAQVDVTEAQLMTARAGVLPQLRLNGSYTHSIKNARAQLNQAFNQPNTYNINANLSQPLFQGGREFAGLRAASRLRGAARLTAAEARANVTLAVERAYLDALYAGRLLDIQTANLQLASSRLTQVVQLEGAGRAARYDVLRARVERANIEPAVIQAASDRELALLDLKRLLNVPPDQPVVLTTSLDPRSVQTLLASFSADTLLPARRASVQAAELTAKARRDAVAVARADLLPTVSVFYQSGYQAFPLAGFPTEFGRVGAQYCPADTPAGRACNNGGFFADQQIGVQLTWALFDGLRTRGNINLARAQAQLADILLNEERETVALQVAQAQAELSRARATFAARQQNSTEATEAFQLASLRFSRGLGTQLDVSDAQVAMLTAQSGEARAVYDLYLASAGLAYALGRPIPFPPSVTPVRTTSAPTTQTSTSANEHDR
jgi:outer membrane protein TolC